MVAVPSLSVLLTYSEPSGIPGPTEQSCEGSTVAEVAENTSTKERVAGCRRGHPRSKTPAVRIGPVAPRLSRDDERVAQGKLWEIAREQLRATPSVSPTCENPAPLKRYLKDAELPHFLWVWGCGGGEHRGAVPTLYVRKLPMRPRDLQLGTWREPSARVAHLRMSSQPAGTEGGHSTTCRAEFIIDELRSRWSRERAVHGMSVIAKAARPLTDSDDKRRSRREYQRDLRMLENEAEIYDAFPPSLMGCEEVVYSDTFSFRCRRRSRTYLVDDPGSALVPKFYGYYVPYEPGVAATRLHGGQGVGAGPHRKNFRGAELSPILLMEDCGKEIRTYGHTDRERLQVQGSLMQRLHDAGFTQGSYRSRNFVVEDRANAAAKGVDGQDDPWCPHFRIIDFGRGTSKKVLCTKYGKEVGLALFKHYLKEERAQIRSAWRETLREEPKEEAEAYEESGEGLS
ncbi:hypothetical protein C8T65DRAFT_730919 [Cerioporus squamosus]|nr:hypothetical protein C8T65DRAFT_730919 [Cerioporus squamosus]